MPKAKVRRKEIFMAHPAGYEFEDVRTFPPVIVPSKRSEPDVLFVYVESDYGSSWRRKRVASGADYPSAFIAWDADAGEWAMHQPGDLSVGEEFVPEDIPQPNTPTMDLLRPEVGSLWEGLTGKTGPAEKRRRRRLREWFLSLSDSNEVPDFLRDKETP